MEKKKKEIDILLEAAVKNKASDLHLKVNSKPIFRISTKLHEAGNVLSPDDVQRLAYEMLTEKQIKHFEETGDVDISYSLDDGTRFRVNIFRERGFIALAARRVNNYIPSFEELHLPAEVLKKVAALTQGLVLVVGPTGQGKSTTLAALLQYINTTRRAHVITIEDPIEYMFKDDKCFFNQREIGIDVPDFHTALKYVVRQNPDIILIGELRDSISVEAGLMAAETGHLVLSTLHASTAAQTIGRILDLFPADKQDAIRELLVFNLKAVFCQKLVPSCKEGIRMVPAVEIMIVNPIIQKLLREKEDHKITDAIRASTLEGMQDFNQAFVKLVKEEKLVSEAVALRYSPNPEQLQIALKGIKLSDERRIIS